MIDFYCWRSGNNRKIFMMLEEVGLPYTRHIVHLRKGEQFAPDYLKLNPNNKTPTIVDQDGPGGEPFTVFESGAILIYLAEKTGQFRPEDKRQWFTTLQWLMFQMASPGPLFTEAAFFHEHAGEPDMAYPEERYVKEALHLLDVVDKRLGESAYIAGPEYSIADMALWPHLGTVGRFDASLDDYPNAARWFALVGERSATQRAAAVIEEVRAEAAAAA
ncbi:MAG: glutathione S-transferase N-terminal domain-containing protein [Alphaproteobacteria bacterium]|nr:glutathione S-transferase N-terminal domain-containing protein [Alphaproteobacteria bacterium]